MFKTKRVRECKIAIAAGMFLLAGVVVKCFINRKRRKCEM